MATQKQSLLSSEEVEALVEGMASGDVDTSPTPGPTPGSVQAYSLVSTDTTTRGQLAALEMINDRLSRQLRGSLLNLLRQAVKVAVNPFEVTTFGSFIHSVPAPCNVNIVRYPPLRGYGLITIDPSIVYGAVDSFFGGRGDGSTDLHPQRGFTPTEERIIQLLLEAVFNDLRDAWAPVYALTPEYVSREINPAFAQVGEERETVVVTRFDLELGAGVRGQISVMYPFSALKPIRLLLRGRMQSGERDEKLAHAWSVQLQDAVMDAELEMVAQLATVRVSALDLAALSKTQTQKSTSSNTYMLLGILGALLLLLYVIYSPNESYKENGFGLNSVSENQRGGRSKKVYLPRLLSGFFQSDYSDVSLGTPQNLRQIL